MTLMKYNNNNNNNNNSNNNNNNADEMCVMYLEQVYCWSHNSSHRDYDSDGGWLCLSGAVQGNVSHNED